MKGFIPAALLVAAVVAIVSGRWQLLMDVLREHGLVAGGAAILFFGFHWWIYHLYEMRIADARASADARVSDRQKEIDRLLAENSEYRDRFIELFDRMERRVRND